MAENNKKYRFETLQLHVGQEQADPATDSRAVPIYQTTSYVFHNFDHAEARFGLADPGNIYGRLTNSTQGVFEDRIAALEGGTAGLAVASGAAAVEYAVRNITQSGDHIVAAKNVYGGTFNLLRHTLPRDGITLGGVIVEGGKFNWAEVPGKFPTLTEPDPSYHGLNFYEALGGAAFVTRIRAILLRDTGATLSPFAAFLLLQGTETLSLRVERHVENALKVIDYLKTVPEVESISHPSIPGRPDHDLYEKYFPNGAGSIFTFDIKGGKDAARVFIDNLHLFSLLANVADAKSLVIHPASTTHSQETLEELEDQGIHQGTIRLSIGTENIEDILDDLKGGFEALRASGLAK